MTLQAQLRKALTTKQELESQDVVDLASVIQNNKELNVIISNLINHLFSGCKTPNGD